MQTQGKYGGGHHSRAEQIQDLVQLLSQIPGGSKIDLVTRRFHRWQPLLKTVEEFRECLHSFDVASLPQPIPFELDAEEVSFCLYGDVSKMPGHQQLMAMIDDLMLASGLKQHWGTRIESSSGNGERYYLRVLEEV